MTFLLPLQVVGNNHGGSLSNSKWRTNSTAAATLEESDMEQDLLTLIHRWE
jgi:hypothetical protein